MARLKDICIDATAVDQVASFWAAVLGYEMRSFGLGRPVHLYDEAGDGVAIWVNPVQEPKTVKDRVHVDVTLTEPTPDALLALGARVLREPGDDIEWWVLADPEGHEFCAFPAGS